jgi:hypothetical protein
MAAPTELALGKKPRVLLVDIETAPLLGWTWGRWEQNVIDVKTQFYMLSFAWKWQGDKRTECLALPDFGSAYTKDKENDKLLVMSMWHLLNSADVVIAHNADAFDIKRTNARFLFHRINPPSPYKTFDTLKAARRFFKMDSNRLDDLGAYLGVGRKVPHTGKHLWFDCMAGKPDAWKKMKQYNRHDVDLLEDVYERLKPWATNHPDLTIYDERPGCPTCQSPDIQKRGIHYARKLKYQKWLCKGCGHWFTGERIK